MVGWAAVLLLWSKLPNPLRVSKTISIPVIRVTVGRVGLGWVEMVGFGCVELIGSGKAELASGRPNVRYIPRFGLELSGLAFLDERCRFL